MWQNLLVVILTVDFITAICIVIVLPRLHAQHNKTHKCRLAVRCLKTVTHNFHFCCCFKPFNSAASGLVAGARAVLGARALLVVVASTTHTDRKKFKSQHNVLDIHQTKVPNVVM